MFIKGLQMLFLAAVFFENIRNVSKILLKLHTSFTRAVIMM
jgi:hypothetical protein